MPIDSSPALYTPLHSPGGDAGEHIRRGDPWSEPGERKEKSEGTERLTEREDRGRGNKEGRSEQVQTGLTLLGLCCPLLVTGR